MSCGAARKHRPMFFTPLEKLKEELKKKKKTEAYSPSDVKITDKETLLSIGEVLSMKRRIQQRSITQ